MNSSSSHLPTMQTHDASPGPGLTQLGALGNVNGLQVALQLAALMTQVPAQNAASLPQHSQSVPVPGAINPADVIALLGLQQLQSGTITGPTAGPAQNAPSVPNALTPGPPVGAYPDDEDKLVQALRQSDENGWTYRKALEGLHGINHHLASQWKDYYLDNVHRINHRVSLQNHAPGKPVIAAKKPSFDDASPPREPSSSRALSNPDAKHPQTAVRKSSEPKAVRRDESPDKKGKAKTFRISSRSPTPPVDVERRGRGVKFTDADKTFLVKYARYRLSADPHVSKSEICQELSSKAPHHSAASWSSHWHIHRDVYDKYLPLHNSSMRPHDETEFSDTHESGSESESDEGETNSETDRKNMGEGGGRITNADKRVVARYIASFGREWATMPQRDRWDPFEAMYPRRKSKSWAEVHRRYDKEIDALVKKYRQRRKSELKSQTGKPTWASSKGASPTAKRAHVDDDNDDDDYPSKRPSA